MKTLLIKTLLIFIIIFSNNQTIKDNNNNNNNKQDNNNYKQNNNNNYNSEILGNIKINKININKPLYKINSKKNNIEENITILKESILPPNNNSIIFIAAHSGTSKISFFKNLNKLEKNDKIILTINNNKYTYVVNNIYLNKKNGYINVNKEKKDQLILTTCSPENDKYQLIINCIKKESN